MENPIKSIMSEKKKDQLGKDFSAMLRYAYRYFDNDNKVVRYMLSLHILSKKDIAVDVEEIFKTIRERVAINNGAIDYLTNVNVSNISIDLGLLGFRYYENNKSITFEPEYRELFENEYRKQRDNLEHNVMFSFQVPVKNVKKRREFFPDHLFIYVAEKRKIYNGYEFITKFLSEFRSKTFYYKGVIQYNRIERLNVLKTEIM